MRIMIGIFVTLSSVTLNQGAHAFANLDELSQFTQTYPEFPKPDLLSWEYTDYSSFYTKRARTFFEKIQQYLGLGKEDDLLAPIQATIDKYLAHYKSAQQPTTIARINAQDEPTLYVWGDLGGSLHSLYRALAYLKEENVIDDNLEIKKKNCFFIFNGNAVNGAPYNLETMMIILNLIEKNPDHVQYLQGKEERNEHWKNGGLRTQIRKMIKHNQEREALETKINDIFKTLPVALYVLNTKQPDQALRISYFDRQSTTWIDESLLGTFFTQEQQTPLFSYTMNAAEKSVKEPFIITIIRGQDWQKEQQVKNGLGLLSQDKGSTAWALLSCPTAAYQKFYGFHYDAFAKLTINQSINRSTITLCNRDIREKDSFKYQEPASLASGKLVETKELSTSKNDIIFGSTMSLVQGVPVMGNRTQNGMMTRITQENKMDGIKEHLIRVVVENDDYNPSKTRKFIHQFIDKNINTVLLPIGSPTLSSYLDLVEKGDVLTLFPITGAPEFRKASIKNIIHFRSSYPDEVNALVDHAYLEWNSRKFVLFYQDDSYGKGPLEAAHKRLEKKNCTLVDIPYSRGTIDLRKHAQKITDIQPDVIAFFSTAQTAIELIRQIGINNVVNKKLMCISFCAEESLRAFIELHNIQMLIGAVVPNPFLSTIPIVAEYRTAMDSAGYLYDVFSLEAYIGTSLLIEALKKMEEPFTKEKIKDALTALKNTTIGGLAIDYHPSNHTLYHNVYLETGNNNEWICKPCEDDHDTNINQNRSKQKSNQPANTPAQPMAP